MTLFDFDTVYNRYQTQSTKWDLAKTLYKNPDILPMWVADMDFRSPQPIIDALTAKAAGGFYGYATALSDEKDCIIDWLKQENNIDVTRKTIHFAPSIVKALSVIIRSLTAEQDAILVHTPCYSPFLKIITNSRRTVVTSALQQTATGYTLDFADLEHQIITHNVQALIFCNPHNPTGRAWTKTELLQVLAICEAHQVLLISDDIHADLVLPGFHYQPFTTLTQTYGDHIITLRSISKTFNLAGLHLGYYLTNNNDYIKKIQATLIYNNDRFEANTFHAAALVAAYTKGKPWLTAVLPYIQANYEYLATELAHHLPAIRVHKLEATYLVWIDATALNCTESQLIQALDAAGVGVQTGGNFGMVGSLYIRMNIACPRTLLQTGTTRLITALQALS